MEPLLRYFPQLTAGQVEQFAALYALYADWNAKINVVSRKDIDNLYIHHVLHSLGIERAVRFRAGSAVMDVGTGGGFPGIPLAILFPEATFHLVDRIGKKIKVAEAVAAAVGLTNVMTRHCSVEEEKGRFDFVVSRAVMPLGELARLVRKNIASEQRNALPNGLLCLKGGELQHELAPFRRQALSIELADHFDEPFFETKKVIYLPL